MAAPACVEAAAAAGGPPGSGRGVFVVMAIFQPGPVLRQRYAFRAGSFPFVPGREPLNGPNATVARGDPGRGHGAGVR